MFRAPAEAVGHTLLGPVVRSMASGHMVPPVVLFDLAHEERDTEAFARRLSRQQGEMPLGQLTPVTGVLGVQMRRQAGAQKEGVLAVFGAQGIDRLIEIGEPLHADHFPEQIELPVIFFTEMVQDDAGGAV